MELNPEAFWAELLSREVGRIVAGWETLGIEEQSVVWGHLQRMVTEDGWLEAQRLSAEAALQTLRRAGFSPPDWR